LGSTSKPSDHGELITVNVDINQNVKKLKLEIDGLERMVDRPPELDSTLNNRREQLIIENKRLEASNQVMKALGIRVARPGTPPYSLTRLAPGTGLTGPITATGLVAPTYTIGGPISIADFNQQVADYVDALKIEADRIALQEIEREKINAIQERIVKLEEAKNNWINNLGSEEAKTVFYKQSLLLKFTIEPSQIVNTFLTDPSPDNQNFAKETLLESFDNEIAMKTLSISPGTRAENLFTQIILNNGKDTEAYRTLVAGSSKQKTMDIHLDNKKLAEDVGVTYVPEKNFFVNKGYVVKIKFVQETGKYTITQTTEPYSGTISGAPGVPPQEFYNQGQKAALTALGLTPDADGKIVGKYRTEIKGDFEYDPATSTWKFIKTSSTYPPTITKNKKELNKYENYEFDIGSDTFGVYIDPATNILYDQSYNIIQKGTVTTSEKSVSGNINLQKSLLTNDNGILTFEIARTKVMDQNDNFQDIDAETYNIVKQTGIEVPTFDNDQLKIKIGDITRIYDKYKVDNGLATGSVRTTKTKIVYEDPDGKSYTPKQVEEMTPLEKSEKKIKPPVERIVREGFEEIVDGRVKKRATITYSREGTISIAETVLTDTKTGDLKYYYLENKNGDVVINNINFKTDKIEAGSATTVITFENGKPICTGLGCDQGCYVAETLEVVTVPFCMIL